MQINFPLSKVSCRRGKQETEETMQTRQHIMHASPRVPLSVSHFLEEKTGASMYEFALVASLVAVVSIIILIALNFG